MKRKMIFTALMFGGMFVDEKNLGRGIYPTLVPILHPEDETIGKMQEKSLKVTQTGSVQHEMHRAWMSNVGQCELVKVELDVLVPVLDDVPAEWLEPGDSLDGVTEIGGVKIEEMTESPGPGFEGLPEPPSPNDDDFLDFANNPEKYGVKSYEITDPASAPSEEDKKKLSN